MPISRIDLDPDYLNLIKDILLKYLPKDARVWVFGSRVTGKAKPYSDIDFVIDIGKELPLEMQAKLTEAFEESTLPYKVDIVDWHTINQSFRNLICSQRIQLI